MLLTTFISVAATGVETPRSPSGAGSPLVREVDVSRILRRFPRLPMWRNTSIQKAPAPALAERSAKEFGKARVTKCWVNLDEMWDYRTQELDFNYRIGVHKYDNVPEKHRETWGSVKETNVHFHDYLQAFAGHSDEVMLTVRRYERDILDGKFGLTMDDWQDLFAKAVKHYRTLCPNLRYIEVCNEYGCKGFIGCSAEEYYRFYQLGSKAVDKVNAELGLEGDDRLLVGGPAVTGDIVTKLDAFFRNFSRDESPDKRLDFVSWHEYNKTYPATALRQGQVEHMMASYGLSADLPMFVTEHDPYHPDAGHPEYNLINGAGLTKSLYFASVYSPGVKIMPWVQYHVAEIQTRFMWFDGPNEPDTRPDELRMLPAGCAMKLLAMHNAWEIAVDNGLERSDLVLASVQNDGLMVQAVNYGEMRDVRLDLKALSSVFPENAGSPLHYVMYLLDTTHSNGVSDPDYPGGLQKVDEGILEVRDSTCALTHPALETNGIIAWVITPEKVGAPLTQPEQHASPAAAPTVSRPLLPVLNTDALLSNATAEADAKVNRDGTLFHVQVCASEQRPGLTSRAPAGGWGLNGVTSVEAEVRNTGKDTVTIHLALDGPNADRTRRLNCAIASASIPPGEAAALRVPVGLSVPPPATWITGDVPAVYPYPGKDVDSNYGLDSVDAVSIYIYHPGQDAAYDVTGLRVISE